MKKRTCRSHNTRFRRRQNRRLPRRLDRAFWFRFEPTSPFTCAMDNPEKTRLLIVDGHAYAYRAFHAIQRLNASDGAPTNAIYGFLKMLSKMEASLQPTHHAVVWD